MARNSKTKILKVFLLKRGQRTISQPPILHNKMALLKGEIDPCVKLLAPCYASHLCHYTSGLMQLRLHAILRIDLT